MGYPKAKFKSFPDIDSAISYLSTNQADCPALDPARLADLVRQFSSANSSTLSGKRKEHDTIENSSANTKDSDTTHNGLTESKEHDRVELRPTKTDVAPESKKESAHDDLICVYTDGACPKNGQAASAAGVGVWFGEADERNISEALPGAVKTNNRAEVFAAIRALQSIPSHTPGITPPVT